MPPPTNQGGVSNVELYKQLDQLREENFQLKQKQRELMLSLNTLKSENEQLLDNAESEIKRMSDFVDKFTQDTEANKKKIVNDYEQRLSQERIKAEEVKQKL
jgi:predicted  nucleic acid-binding Zn-ribbon protein